MSIEELASLSISSASKRTQSVFAAPAAVSVILPEEMRRFGHNSAAEALRMVPGVHVARRDSSQWAVGVRGFNGLTSTKLLVLVDGRTVYSPFYAGVAWSDADLPFEDLGRIEVVRGPGATIWGANAMNGIVNLVAKDARETLGGVLSARDGSYEGLDVYARHGAEWNDHTAYRVYARSIDTKDSLGPPAGDGRLDHESQRVGFRIDLERYDAAHITWEGEYARTASTGVSHDPFTQQAHPILDEAQHGFVLGRLRRVYSPAQSLVVQAYASLRDGTARNTKNGPGTVRSGVSEDGYNLDLDITHSVVVGDRHALIWGGGVHRDQLDLDVDATMIVRRPKTAAMLYNLFAQDEITLVSERLRLTAGSKLEHHDDVGWQLLPSMRLAWQPTSRLTGWAAVSRAVRSPSRSERDSRFTIADIPASDPMPAVRVDVAGRESFREEVLIATEAGWRWQPRPNLRIELGGHIHDYDQLRNLTATTIVEPSPPRIFTTYGITNDLRARGYGSEFSIDWRVSERWHLAAGHSYQRLEAKGDFEPSLIGPDFALPRHLCNVRSWWDLGRDLELTAAAYHAGSIDGQDVPAYLRLDVQITWRPRFDLECSVGVQNASDPSHAEFYSIGTSGSTEVPRNVYGQLKWRF